MAKETCSKWWVVPVILLAVLIGLGLYGHHETHPWAKMSATSAHLRVVEIGLEMYCRDHGGFPPPLAVLYGSYIEAGGRADGGKLREGTDAWNRPFVYELEPDGTAMVVSYGADGQPGGVSYNQDLTARIRPLDSTTRPSAQTRPGRVTSATGDEG